MCLTVPLRLQVSEPTADEHDELRQCPAARPRGVSAAEQLCDDDVCVRAGELRRHGELETLLCEQSAGTGGSDTRRGQAGSRGGPQ